jgi:hypothetical protein
VLAEEIDHTGLCDVTRRKLCPQVALNEYGGADILLDDAPNRFVAFPALIKFQGRDT